MGLGSVTFPPSWCYVVRHCVRSFTGTILGRRLLSAYVPGMYDQVGRYLTTVRKYVCDKAKKGWGKGARKTKRREGIFIPCAMQTASSLAGILLHPGAPRAFGVCTHARGYALRMTAAATKSHSPKSSLAKYSRSRRTTAV